MLPLGQRRQRARIHIEEWLALDRPMKIAAEAEAEAAAVAIQCGPPQRRGGPRAWEPHQRPENSD